MKFKQYLTEARNKLVVTIRDLQKIEDKVFRSSYKKDIEFNVDFLVDQWFEGGKQGKKDVGNLLKMLSQAGTKALQILGNVPYFDKYQLIYNMLDVSELPYKVSDFFPMSVYVSASPNDKQTIGIMVHANGKKEMFEGSDEASEETYDLVDEILGNIKPVTVYGFHGEETVEKIRKSNVLPKGLYMSPSKKYALGYWSLEENRLPFEKNLNMIGK